MADQLAAFEASAALSTAHGTWALFWASLAAAGATLLAVIVALVAAFKPSRDARREREALHAECKYAAEIGHMEIGQVPPLLDPSRLTKVEEFERQEQRLADANAALGVFLNRELLAPFVFSVVEMRRLIDTGRDLLAKAREFPGGYRNDGTAHTTLFNQSTLLLCVFHVMVGTDSTARWARIPREAGHGFHAMVGAP